MHTQVHDMRSPDADLSGAMLCGVIKKMRLFGKAWHELLPLAVAWNHEAILRSIMGRLRTSDAETQPAIEAAFHDAFLGNKVDRSLY